MIRETSIEAYNEIKENGLLTKLRFQVYDWLFRNGASTQSEICNYGFPNTRMDSIKPRIAELNRLGVVSSVGERKCKVTGRNVMIWDITKKLPIKLDKQKREKCKHCNGSGYDN